MVYLKVYVSPGSKKSRIVKLDDYFKFFLSSKPVDGRANQELIKTISKILKIPQARVLVSKGQSSRLKVLEIDSDLDENMINEILNKDSV